MNKEMDVNVTGLPRVPLTPMAVQARSSAPTETQPNGNVTARKPDTVQVAAASSNMMELSQRFNLQFLMLQQEMQMENRQFTTLSNVMKTKHSTASGA